MRLKLNQAWTDYFITLPESGMGYQVVNVFLKNGQILKNIVVLNCSELILDQDIELSNIERIEAAPTPTQQERDQ